MKNSHSATRSKASANGSATPIATSLADQINTEHQACVKAASDALDHAMTAGDLLTQAKASCAHGDWQAWLADNFTGSARTARLYMRLADRREEIEAKRQSVATLGVRAAQKLLAKPADIFDEIFGADLALKIDEMLNGPLCPLDFESDWRWLQTKIAHKTKLPAIAGFVLTTKIETEPSLLRVVDGDDLVESIRILAKYKKGTDGCGFDSSRVTPHHFGMLNIVLARMLGALLTEFDHRKKATADQLAAEHKTALEQFIAEADARIAELEAAKATEN